MAASARFFEELVLVVLRFRRGLCRDAPPRYRTIMAYRDNCDIPRVNWFSNPDVMHLNKPTGDATHNNAQCIKDSMVRSVKSIPQVSQLEVASVAGVNSAVIDRV